MVGALEPKPRLALCGGPKLKVRLARCGALTLKQLSFSTARVEFLLGSHRAAFVRDVFGRRGVTL